MEHASTRFTDSLIALAIPVALVAALPLLAVVAFLLRPLLFLAAIAVLLVVLMIDGRHRSNSDAGASNGHRPPTGGAGR